MGDALTFADAGEMLSDENKIEILGQVKKPFPVVPDVKPSRVVLVGDQGIRPEALESTIQFCLQHKAILDLLCVLPQSNSTEIHLAKAFSRLESETDLDFQITRQHGDLLAVTKAYIDDRKDTLMILINVSDRLRRLYAGKWSQSFQHPVIKLLENINSADNCDNQLRA